MPLGMDVGLVPGNFVLDGDPSPAPQKGMEVGLSPGDFVLDGDPAPSQKGGAAPSLIFGPFLLWPYDWKHQDATWYEGRPQPRGLCARWGPRSPSPKRGRSCRLQFSAHVYCGQTAEWIRMILGMKVGLSPGALVLDRDPSRYNRRVQGRDLYTGE